jgi:hypothetical protein
MGHREQDREGRAYEARQIKVNSTTHHSQIQKEHDKNHGSKLTGRKENSKRDLKYEIS